MRGLKPLGNVLPLNVSVASFTDAWIETLFREVQVRLILSHLLQMRGLKLQSASAHKLILSVASFTDAWIET